jgi:hypothetical protein
VTISIIPDREVAKAAARAAAVIIEEDGNPAVSSRRTILHSFAGMIGADWDLAAVLDLIDAADRVAWNDNHLFRHALAVYDTNGRAVHFQVPLPDGMTMPTTSPRPHDSELSRVRLLLADVLRDLERGRYTRGCERPNGECLCSVNRARTYLAGDQ